MDKMKTITETEIINLVFFIVVKLKCKITKFFHTFEIYFYFYKKFIMKNLIDIVSKFEITGKVTDVRPMGEGLINDTYKVFIDGSDKPKYVLQRINNAIFQDVDMLMDNINKVTDHIRKKGKNTLQFLKTESGKSYYFDGEKYWRVMLFVPDSITYQAVTPEYSYIAGKSFGEFESLLADLKEPLGEIIPDFHNIEFRLKQLRDAVAEDRVGRVKEVKYLLDLSALLPQA